LSRGDLKLRADGAAPGPAHSGRRNSCPTAFKRYAVDADGDGPPATWSTDPARSDRFPPRNNLKKRTAGRRGRTWGLRGVVVPQRFQLHAWRTRAKIMTMPQWGASLGLTRAGGPAVFPAREREGVILSLWRPPAAGKVRASLMLQNFRVHLENTNPAEAYAPSRRSAISPTRLRGRPTLRAQPWPRQERETVARRAAGTANNCWSSAGSSTGGTPDGQFGGRDATGRYAVSRPRSARPCGRISPPSERGLENASRGAVRTAEFSAPKASLKTTFAPPSL